MSDSILVVSDIHGSKFYANKVLELYNEINPKVLVLLGDLYNHGPRNNLPKDYAPMEVAKIFNSIAKDIIVIKGNCDSEVDQMISEFTFVDFAELFCFDKKITLSHGHKFNIDNLPKNAGDIFIYGHTHKSMIKKVEDTVVLNPGSISLPKDGTNSYMVIDKDSIVIYDENSNQILKSTIDGIIK